MAKPIAKTEKSSSYANLISLFKEVLYISKFHLIL